MAKSTQESKQTTPLTEKEIAKMKAKAIQAAANTRVEANRQKTAENGPSYLETTRSEIKDSMPVDSVAVAMKLDADQEKAYLSLSAISPEQFETCEGETFRIREIGNPHIEFEIDEIELDEMAADNAKKTGYERRTSFDMGNFISNDNDEGYYVALSGMPYEREGAADGNGCCVYLNLMRKGAGRVRPIEVGARISGKLDEMGQRVPAKSPANFVLEGHWFRGDRDQETGLPVKVVYIQSGVYLNQAGKNLKEYLSETMGRLSMSEGNTYWEHAALHFFFNR